MVIMAEGSKVRLVRCPKCDNLLPELPEYSVYQCGGCGTILRAKKKGPGSDVPSEKSDEENGFGRSERLESSAEKASGGVDFASETEDGNWRRKERVFVEKKANFGNRGFKRTEKEEISVREDIGITGEFKDLRLDRRFEEMEYGRFSDHETDQRTPGAQANRRVDINGVRSVNSSVEETSKVPRSLRSRPRMDWSSVERGRLEQKRPSPKYSYADEGPSNYDPYPYPNVPANGVEQLEQERAELLRKLDELKEQLSRSKERESSDPYINPPIPTHFLDHTQQGRVDARNFYPLPRHNMNQIPEYDDPFQPRHHHRPPHLHPYVSPREYYRNFDPYPQENVFHTPACSCLSCYNNQISRVPIARVNPNSNFFHHDNDPGILGPQGYPPRHMKWPGELESEEHDVYGHPRRAVASNTTGRHYRPVAGGAPFISCRKCFELLKLPRKKLRTASKYRQKLRCGACSALILVKVENKRLITSDFTELKHTPAEEDQSIPEVLNDSTLSSGSLNCSEDIKKSSFNFRSAVTDHKSLIVEERRTNSDDHVKNNNNKNKVYSSSPSVSSREEGSVPCSAVEFPLETVSSPVPPRSPMWQELEGPRQGNTSKRSENESAGKAFRRLNSRENCVRDESEATELDVPFDEYQHNMSEDFAETSKEDYPLRFSKGASDSFLVGFIKRSFRDFSRSSHSAETEKPKVFINGQPLRDRVVKSAEMYAGPIRPGDYWYDYKAGFWGVMGQPCLGIIPPGIEEFNYPMPTNCGAGNTSVYVNGRELNLRDLDLLASRGLPTTSNKFYIVEINGNVIDEGTGKEVNNLGRLAPTVEKAKHGFGMKVPRSVS